MQKLILITGEAWTGKTSCSELLFSSLDNSAWLDGDDVWRVNPFSYNDKRLRNSDLNMAFVINNYLKSKFEYVILSSIVLCDEGILHRILELIKYNNYELIYITLFASEEVLKKRAQIRDNNLDPNFMLLKRSLQDKEGINTHYIDTNNASIEEVVNTIIDILEV